MNKHSFQYSFPEKIVGLTIHRITFKTFFKEESTSKPLAHECMVKYGKY